MDMVDDARRLRDEYEATLDEAESKRFEYHAVVVALHRSGTTYREIAEALGISHQRVHQIVTGERRKTEGRSRASKVAIGLVILLALSLGIAAALRLTHHRSTPSTSPGFATVPDVIGLRIDLATTQLNAARLCVGGQGSERSLLVPAIHVIRTIPGPGNRISPFSRVVMVLSKGPGPPGSTPLPDSLTWTILPRCTQAP
jgi:hypothetical protein